MVCRRLRAHGSGLWRWDSLGKRMQARMSSSEIGDARPIKDRQSGDGNPHFVATSLIGHPRNPECQQRSAISDPSEIGNFRPIRDRQFPIHHRSAISDPSEIGNFRPIRDRQFPIHHRSAISDPSEIGNSQSIRDRQFPTHQRSAIREGDGIGNGNPHFVATSLSMQFPTKSGRTVLPESRAMRSASFSWNWPISRGGFIALPEMQVTWGNPPFSATPRGTKREIGQFQLKLADLMARDSGRTVRPDFVGNHIERDVATNWGLPWPI